MAGLSAQRARRSPSGAKVRGADTAGVDMSRITSPATRTSRGESPDTATRAETFARSLDALGPYESKPHIAAAVSGGPDSLALAFLADRWARARGGRVTALTVDHGLRPEAAREARQVARWLKAAGMRHFILRWRHDRAALAIGESSGEAASHAPTPGNSRLANVQAAARSARYRLLGDWCREHGVLHLLLAHHREDQAETLLLRLGRGSGLDGLAAMAPVVERGALRLVRPLLDVSKAELAAYLVARGQAWIADPSNRDPTYARVRLRRLMPALAAEGLTANRLAETAARLAQARSALATQVVDLLARAATIHPEGYLALDARAVASAPREIGLRALAQAIACIGGSAYGPRLERLERLYALLREDRSALGRGCTLGGCRIVPAPLHAKAADGAVLVMREIAGVAPALPVNGAAPVLWDGRFSVATSEGLRDLEVGALGEADWRMLQQRGVSNPLRLPRDVIVTLPAVRRHGSLLAVPHLGYEAANRGRGESRPQNRVTGRRKIACEARFAPISPLTRPGFTLV